jgi:6,7-dimethyl-8-ribityllumazine synthase
MIARTPVNNIPIMLGIPSTIDRISECEIKEIKKNDTTVDVMSNAIKMRNSLFL